jgi:hypothetical protein
VIETEHIPCLRSCIAIEDGESVQTVLCEQSKSLRAAASVVAVAIGAILLTATIILKAFVHICRIRNSCSIAIKRVK